MITRSHHARQTGPGPAALDGTDPDAQNAAMPGFDYFAPQGRRSVPTAPTTAGDAPLPAPPDASSPSLPGAPTTGRWRAALEPLRRHAQQTRAFAARRRRPLPAWARTTLLVLRVATVVLTLAMVWIAHTMWCAFMC